MISFLWITAAMAGEADIGGGEPIGNEDTREISAPADFGGDLSVDLFHSSRDREWLSNADLSLWLEADLGTLIGADDWYAFLNPNLVWGAEEDWGWKARVYQGWLAYDGNETWNVLFGMLDPSWHFHSLPSAAVFVRMPSRVAGEFSPGGIGLLDLYPVSAPAIRMEWKPGGFLYLQTAAFWLQEDHAIRGREVVRSVAAGQRWLVMAEGGWKNEGEEESGWKHRQAAVGGWLVPAEPETWGMYSIADCKLWSEGDDWQGLSGFLSLSTAHTPGEEQEYRGTAGLLHDGLVPNRDEDTTALAIIAEHPRNLSWEILHRFSLNQNQWIQVSLQWQDNGQGGQTTGGEFDEDWRIGLRFGTGF